MSRLADCLHKVGISKEDEADIRAAIAKAGGDEQAGLRTYLAGLQGDLADLRHQLKRKGFDLGERTLAAAAQAAAARAPEPAAKEPAPEPPKPVLKWSPTPAGIHALAQTQGVPSDNDRAFMAFTQQLTGKRHLDDMSTAELLKVGKALADGRKPAPITGMVYGANNKLFTETAADKARKLLRDKLKNQLNSGIDPEILQAGLTLAGFHIEAGARSFTEYVKAMVADLGDAAKPYLRSWYEGVRHYPGVDVTGMTPADHILSDQVYSPQAAKETAANDQAPGRTEPLANSGDQSLEGVPAGEVRVPPGERQAGPGSPRGGGNDLGGNGSVEGPGHPARGSVAGGPGEVAVPARGPDANAGGRGNDANDGGARGLEDGKRAVPTVGGPGLLRQPATSYVITAADRLGEGGQVGKYNDNVAAIRLLKKLADEHRQATPEEQGLLVKYVGWGGIKQAFGNSFAEFREGWGERNKQLRGYLTPQEYREAETSVLNAHYTSETVVRGIYQAIAHFGFEHGAILEPAMGTGNFIGLMPLDVRSKSQITGVELDPTTGNIAKQLYPEQNVLAPMGFQDAPLADDHFDLAIGNPPFGGESVPGAKEKDIGKFSIHNYFFARTINKLRPGGIMAMVVTRAFLDKEGGAQRDYIADRAKFLGAIRLPNTAFLKNAGTEVTTDVVFLQKLQPGEQADRTWTKVGELEDPLGGAAMPVNQYFIDHPDMMLGRMERSGMMRQAAEPALSDDGRDLPTAIQDAVAKLPAKVFEHASTARSTQQMVKASAQPAPEAAAYDVGMFYTEGKKLFRRIETGDGSLAAEELTPATQWTEKTKLGDKKFARIVGQVQIRNVARKLLRMEYGEATDKELQVVRKQLNQSYDDFVKLHGYLRDTPNETIMKDDPDAPLLFALEKNYDPGISEGQSKKLGIPARGSSAEKSEMFSQRVIPKWEPVRSAANAHDALGVSLAEMGEVNIAHMANLVGTTEDEIVRQLYDDAEKPSIFKDPQTQEWQPAAIYLSGNVKLKERQAREAGYIKNANALRDVFPADIPASQITVKLGSSWVDAKHYKDFATHLFGEGTRSSVVYLPHNGLYIAEFTAGSAVKSQSQWGTPAVDGPWLLNRIMNGGDVTIRRKVGDSTVVDQPATIAAQAKVDEIKAEFDDWIMKEQARRQELSKFYNDNFNTSVAPKYDGSHITLPGKVPYIEMRRHQRDAIWRTIATRTALYDHVVGAGKTFNIIAAAMELRRMGLVKKPMIAVPNHLVSQWAADFYKLYPGAKILTMNKNDFTKRNRQRLLAKIATGDWDAVIIAHSSFGFLGVEKAREEAFITKQIQDIQSSIDAARRAVGDKGRKVGDMVRSRQRMEAKLRDLREKPQDNIMTFEQLGVDQLFVDEAHEFKNLFFTTSQRGMLGLGNPAGSKKALDMFMKTQYLLDKQNGKGVVFATGTPISNSLSEMYTIQRYLGLKELESRGILSFDSWLNTFGDAFSDYELDGTGVKYKRVNRLRSLNNVPEVMALYQQYTDSVTMEDIKKAYAEENGGKAFPIPAIEHGPRENIVVPRSNSQADYFEKIIKRAENIKPGGRDNMLSITTDARKAALDMRLVDPSALDSPTSKTNIAVEDIVETWRKWEADKGTQLVFCDLSIPLSAAKKTGAGLRELQEKISEKSESLREALRIGHAVTVQSLEEEISELEEKIAEKYSTDDITALQSAASGFSVQDDLRAKLIDRGIPEREIAFIHDANTDDQKADLFAAVNAGSIRVLVGTTAKMGAGTNVQERLVAEHHLDCPWRPSDIEQREGRIVRQGNKLLEKYGPDFKVRIRAYATEQTYDARMWQVQEQKLRGIEGVRNYKGDRTMEEVAAGAATAAEMKAAATGNPLIMEEVKLADDIRKLDIQQRSHRRVQQDLEDSVSGARETMQNTAPLLEQFKRDQDQAGAYTNDQHAGLNIAPMTIEGRQVNDRAAADKVLEQVRAAAQEEAKAAKQKNITKQVTIDGTAMSFDSAYTAIVGHFGDVDKMAVSLDGADAPFLNRTRLVETIAGRGVDGVKGTVAGFPFEVTSEVQENHGLVTVIAKGAARDYSFQTVTENGKIKPENLASAAASLIKGIPRNIVDSAERAPWRVENAKKVLAEAGEQLGKPWPKVQELTQKRARLAEVRKLLTEQPKPSEGGMEPSEAHIDEPGPAGISEDYMRLPPSTVAQGLTRRQFLRTAAGTTIVLANGRSFAHTDALQEYMGKPGASLKGALGIIARTSADPQMRNIAQLVNAKLRDGDVTLKLIRPGVRYAEGIPSGLNSAYGVTETDLRSGEITVYLRDDPRGGNVITGVNEETIVHESIHAAVKRGFGKFSGRGLELIGKSNPTPVEKAAMRLFELRDQALEAFARLDPAARAALAFEVRAGLPSEEFIAYALTSQPMQDWLKTQPFKGNYEPLHKSQAEVDREAARSRRSMWQVFSDALRSYFAVSPKPESVSLFDAALDAGQSMLENLDDTGAHLERTWGLGKESSQMAIPPRVEFTDPEAEREFQDARQGIKTPRSFREVITEAGDAIASSFRHYKFLPNIGRFADVREQLRKLEAAPQASKERVLRYLENMTRGMTAADLELFTRKVILDDLTYEAQQGHRLPFRLTPESVPDEMAKVDAALQARPDLVDKVRARKRFVSSIAQQLVDAGVLDRERIKNPAYYRHQVLDYARAQMALARSTDSKVKAPKWAKRMGSELAINANLLEAEFDWLQKALTDIETAKTIKWIKGSEHNIREDVLRQVREHNRANLAVAISADMQRNGFSKNGRMTSPMNEMAIDFKRRIAMGFAKIRDEIENGNLVPPAVHQDAADAIQNQDIDAETKLFPFLAWVLDNDKPGAMGAAMAFKAMNARKLFMQQALGANYMNPMDLTTATRKFAPEGYKTWQPDEGKLLYTAKTLPEHVVDGFMDRLAQEDAGPISAQEMRQAMGAVRNVLAVGGDRYQMVLPGELADTLNHLRDEQQNHIILQLIETPLKWWKRWTLISPRRVLKYNLNNLSGDLDAVIAGNPHSLGRMREAIGELYQVMYKNAAPSARYQEALDRGVFDSGLSIQEIPDINEMDQFRRLIEPAEGSNRVVAWGKTGLARAWNFLQKSTQFRENWLRYAAYLDYADRLERGEPMSSIGYGAANPQMVDGISSPKDKAALLARELVGDYGAVSHTGQWLRRTLLPFYSWLEINARRYTRLSMNAWGEGIGRGLATTGYLGAVLGARTTAYLALRMFAMYGLMNLWNYLWDPKDEEAMDDQQRAQLHLLLGRGPDGQVYSLRLQGALSDYLSWFGLSDAAMVMGEINKGRADLGDMLKTMALAPVNKIAGSLTPLLTLPIESTTGFTFWPDVSNPIPVRDKWRNLAQTFNLENEFDLASNRPSRGFGQSLKNLLLYSRDPGEIAYNKIRGLTYDWLAREKGESGAGNDSTARSRALYDWKLAEKYGDHAAAAAAYQKLKELKVTSEERAASIRRMNPLGALAEKDRGKFIKTLTPVEREQLLAAHTWYKGTFHAAGGY